MKRLMFYCQHVLGMGHFIRSSEIVRGLVRHFDVCFLNGGEIIPGFDLPASVEVINLPPIRADAEFRDIHAVDGSANLNEIKEIRKLCILDQYTRIKPDILVIELFPFGRLKFAFELLPLLEQIEKTGRGTKVVCSLRDILVSKREQQRFDEDACRIVNRHYDLLLVHSDPRFQRLDETFQRVSDLKCPIRYTGFVAQSEDENEPIIGDGLRPAGSGEKTIVVSIGGGRVGSELIDCAVKAGVLIGEMLPHRMSIFTGPYLPEDEVSQIQSQIEGRSNFSLQRYTTQFISYLRAADLSISMAGYNTCMNLITARTRAIVYPFTGNNNQEQAIRATKLRELGIVEVINPHELKPERLAEKIMLILRHPKPGTDRPALDLCGVEKTVEALTEIAKHAK
jgi:predicted glycosyltransferase